MPQLVYFLRSVRKFQCGGDILKETKHLGLILAGTIAGAVNGLFGAGGGMVLVPMLLKLTQISDEQIFPSSISILLPICIVSLSFGAANGVFAFHEALPYLLGGCFGGIIAGLIAKKVPTVWLHRLLGVLILWGGIRYLW